MPTPTFDIAADAPATFAARTWLADKADDVDVPEAGLADACGARWANGVDEALIQINEVFQGDRVAPGLSSNPILAVRATPLSITNSTTVTDLLGYTIPAGTLAADQILHVRLSGTYLNNSGAVRTPPMAITLGGTTLWADNWNSNGATATVTPWMLEFYIGVESSTLVHLSGTLRQHTTNQPDTGLGAADNTGLRMNAEISSATGGVTVSSLASGSRLLSVNFNHPIATATQTMIRTMYVVRRVAA